MARQHGAGCIRGQGCLLAVPQPVHDPHQHPVRERLDHVHISRLRLARDGKGRGRPFNQALVYSFHFLTVTVVP